MARLTPENGKVFQDYNGACTMAELERGAVRSTSPAGGGRVQAMKRWASASVGLPSTRLRLVT